MLEFYQMKMNKSVICERCSPETGYERNTSLRIGCDLDCMN